MRQLRTLVASDNNIAEFVRFCTVGVICAIIDWTVFSIACFITKYQISVIAGFVVSFVANYLLSAHWTFKKKPTKSNFVGLISAHLINLFIVRMGVLYILVEIVGLQERISYIPTLMISAITSFVMVRYVFKKI